VKRKEAENMKILPRNKRKLIRNTSGSLDAQIPIDFIYPQ